MPDTDLWLGSRRMAVSSSVPLVDGTGAVVARVPRANQLVQHQMVEAGRRAQPVLAEIDDVTWFAIFTRAAAIVERRLAEGRLDETLSALSRSTGLPLLRVRRGVGAVAGHLRHIEAILAAQSPDGTVVPYRTGESGRPWRWRPAGRTCLVRVPANFPTIMIEWLQVLAARRPTLINTSDRDPFTAGIFVSALYEAGLPDGAVSVCHGDAEVLVRLADQVVWPGEDVATGNDPGRWKTYHFGRSKVVLLDDDAGGDTWERLARLAFEGSGRLCTNMSALAVPGDAEAAARRLAEAFGAHPVRPRTDPRARVPSFPDRALADSLVGLLQRETAAGAVDMTAKVSGEPLRAERDGEVFLRPTVLLAEPDSPLFGLELPFPCTVVARVPVERLVEVCSPSLIVSVVGDDPGLVDRLLAEPGITKVFGGEHYDRGYDPVDPQEGYLADFLFQKKAQL